MRAAWPGAARAARQLGFNMSQDQVAALISLGQRGASIHELGQTAGRLGLRATPVRISISQLGDVHWPAVAHQSDGHFVTLFEHQAGSVLVGDPADGIRTLSLEAFRQHWSGHLLLLSSAVPLAT